MKTKTFFLTNVMFVFLLMYSTGIHAQNAMSNLAEEKNGTVYIKHPAIEKTKMLWAAFEKGDKAAFGGFLADSMVANFNGSTVFQKKEDYLKSLDWWSTEFENLKVVDDAPAYPDAIDYTKGGLWVQDWLLVTGTHKKSGINLNLHLHNLYSFNKDGKITSLEAYYNTDQAEAITSSGFIQENGKVYINHPYIVAVRKSVNAYCAKNIVTLSEFFSPDAVFSNSTTKWGVSIDLAAAKKEWEADFAKYDNIKMRQVGYPDCIYYAKDDSYAVYSWWVWSGISKANGKKIESPLMLSDSFNKEGKIVSEEAYYSSNHFE
jgi:ketosteroid isomerase-like protein